MKLCKKFNRAGNLAIALGFVLAVCATAAVSAAPRELTYSWAEVAGARGYAIEVRDSKGTVVVRERTQQNQILLKLEPGEYEHRIATLNKFGRPGVWTGWIPLIIRVSRIPKIERIEPAHVVLKKERKKSDPPDIRTIRVIGKHFLKATKVQLRSQGRTFTPRRVRVVDSETLSITLDANRLAPGRFDILLENPLGRAHRSLSALVAAYTPPPGKSTRPDGPLARSRVLVPGLAAYDRKEYWKAGIWAAVFAGYAGAGYSQYAQGNKAAAEGSSGFVGVFRDPAQLAVVGSAVAGSNTTGFVAASLLALDQSRSLEKKHAGHQRNQAYIGGAALATYIGMLYSETAGDRGWRAVLPGYAELNEGRWMVGGAWAGAMLGAAGWGYYELRSANARAGYLRNNYAQTMLTNPVYLFGLASQLRVWLANPITASALLVDGPMTAAADKAAYQRHTRNQGYAGGLAALTLIGYLAYGGDSAKATRGKGRRTARSTGPQAGDSFFALGTNRDPNGQRFHTLRYSILF